MRLPFPLVILLVSAPLPLAQQAALPGAGASEVPTVCFAEGTPEAYVRAVVARLPQTAGYQLTNRWSGAQGTPRTVTWSFVPDGLSVPGVIGEPSAPSDLFATLDAQFAAQGGRATWILRFQQAFDRWEELSGLDFERITFGGNDWDDGAVWLSSGNANRGDIRVAMQPMDGPNGTLAFAFFPSNGDMVFDSTETWSGTIQENRRLRNIAMHEIGHSIGLRHVCSAGTTFLMEPFLTLAIDGPQHDDVRAVQRHYGDPNEPDDSFLAATDLGPVLVPAVVGPLPTPVAGANPFFSSIATLDDSLESDWYELEIPGPLAAELVVTLDPRGLAYDDNPQNPDGSCPTGATTDSEAIHDLVLTLHDAAGLPLTTVDDRGAGESESLRTIVTPGTYFLQVLTLDVAEATQMYQLSVHARRRLVLPGFPPGGPVLLPL